MAERILITGGAGTLGRALGPLLRDRGDLVRLVDVVPMEEGDWIEAVAGDLRDPAAVDRVMA